MQVFVYDSIREASPRRVEFVRNEIASRLESLQSVIHRLDATLCSEGGLAGPRRIRCHLTATTGPMGTVVADAQRSDCHHALNTAIEKLTRGLRRRIGQRQKRRTETVEPVEATAVG